MAATFSSPPSKHTDNDMETAYLEHTETAFTAMQCCCASNKETSIVLFKDQAIFGNICAITNETKFVSEKTLLKLKFLVVEKKIKVRRVLL